MKLFNSNEWQYRLARTAIQAVIGTVLAFGDKIIGKYIIDDVWRPFIVALVMNTLSPIMAMIKAKDSDDAVLN